MPNPQRSTTAQVATAGEAADRAGVRPSADGFAAAWSALADAVASRVDDAVREVEREPVAAWPGTLAATSWRAVAAPLFSALRTASLIGPGREVREALLDAAEAGLDATLAAGDYGVVVLEIVARAQRAFVDDLARGLRDGDAPSTVRELAEAYMDAGERVATQAFRTERFGLVQARAVNAALVYRVRERAVVDLLLRYGHLVGRTEVDDVHRRLQELTREVRALRRAVPVTAHRGEETTPR